MSDLDVESALWVRSIGAVLPWEGEPPITRQPGFGPRTDRWDLLHVFYLGVGRVTAGSIIAAALLGCFAVHHKCE